MARIDLDMDELLEGFTRDGMKRFVKKLLMANEAEEKKLLAQLNKGDKKEDKNDLADLDEEMHGKPNTPRVEDDNG
jgi:hemerythrin superfamily protein